MPKATSTNTTPAAEPQLRKNAEHPDKIVLAVSAELCAIVSGENPKRYADRLDLLKESLLNVDAQTLEGCRARILAIETAWPGVWDRLSGAPMEPHDEVIWSDWKRLPKKEQDNRFAARMRERSETKYPELEPEEVLKRALAAAETKTWELYDALKLFDSMAPSDEEADDDVALNRDALNWLVERLKTGASDIGNHLDYAKRAQEGKIYYDAHKQYAEKEGVA